MFSNGIDAGNANIENFNNIIKNDDRNIFDINDPTTGTLLRLWQGGQVVIPNGDLFIGGHQLGEARIENRTSDPSGAGDGRIWIRTDL